MFSPSSYRSLCPFLYPPAARRYVIAHHRSLHGRSIRALSTSSRQLKLLKDPEITSPETTAAAAVSAAVEPPSTRSGPPSPNDRVPASYEGEQHIKERLAEMPLKFLDRPLGMALPPNTKHKLRQDVEADLAAREKKLKEREHLVKQVLTGYYNDVHQLKYHGGKRWIAPEVLVRADMALYFPDLEGTSLSENKTVHTTDLCKGKITILCIIGSQMAETHIAEYTKMVLTSFGNDPRFRFVQINLQENPLKAFLVSMFTRRIKSQVPPQYHATYLLSSYNMEYYREPLGCTNKMLGYVYLLDEDCKIRWAAGGHPNPEEQVSLHKCTGVLLKRLRQTGNTKASRPAVSSVQSTKGGKK